MGTVSALTAVAAKTPPSAASAAGERQEAYGSAAESDNRMTLPALEGRSGLLLHRRAGRVLLGVGVGQQWGEHGTDRHPARQWVA